MRKRRDPDDVMAQITVNMNELAELHTHGYTMRQREHIGLAHCWCTIARAYRVFRGYPEPPAD